MRPSARCRRPHGENEGKRRLNVNKLLIHFKSANASQTYITNNVPAGDMLHKQRLRDGVSL